MALDPSIGLNTNLPPPVDMFAGVERGMNMAALAMKPEAIRQAIAASKATQALTEAQTPGAAEQSAQQAIKTSQDRGRVKAAQDAVELDDNGKPSIDPLTGTLKINRAKHLYGLYKAGLGKEALEAESNQFKAMQEQQKVTGTAIDMNNSVRNHLAVAAKAKYDQTTGTDAEKTAAAKVVWEQLAKLAVDGSKKTGLAFDEDQLKYSPGMEQVLYKAQITPGTQISLDQGQQNITLGNANLKLATAQFDNSKLLNFTDDASMDPASPASQRARDIVKNTTGEVLPNNMRATDIYNNPKYKNVLTSVGANVAAHMTAARQTVNTHDAISKAIDAAQPALGAAGLRPAQFMQNWLAGKLADTPELRALYALLSHESMIGIVSAADSFKSLKAVNDAMGARAKVNLEAASGNAPKAPVIGSGQSPNVKAGDNLVPKAEEKAGPVPMKVLSPQGKIRTIDASTWPAAKAQGYLQVK